MKKVILFIFLIQLLIFSMAYSQEFAKVGTAGAQFLKIGVDARAVAMSDAYSAVCQDAGAVYWNPAGLAYSRNYSVLLSHAEWIADITYEAGVIAKTIGSMGTVGLSVAYLSSGDIQETTVEQQDGTGRYFNASDLMVGLSFARQLSDKFSVGGTVKYIREELDTESASALAFDIGTLYYTGFKSLRMGMYIRNFGPELEIDGTYNDYDNGSFILDPDTKEPEDKDYLPYHMPMTFAVGIAYDFFKDSQKSLTAAVDLVHPNDNVEKFTVGAELGLMNMLFLRGGYVSPFGILGKTSEEFENQDQPDEYSYQVENYTQNFSAGVGLLLDIKGLGSMSLDYAYTDYGVLDFVHRGSLAINF